MIAKVLDTDEPQTLLMVRPKYDVVIVPDNMSDVRFIGHVMPADTRDEYLSSFRDNGTVIYANRLDLTESEVESLKGASFRFPGRTGPDFLQDYVEGLAHRGWPPKDAQYALDDVCDYFLSN